MECLRKPARRHGALSMGWRERASLRMGMEQTLEGKLAPSMLGRSPPPSRGYRTNAHPRNKKSLCAVGAASIGVRKSCSQFVCSYRGHSWDSGVTLNTARTMCYCPWYRNLLFLPPQCQKGWMVPMVVKEDFCCLDVFPKKGELAFQYRRRKGELGTLKPQSLPRSPLLGLLSSKPGIALTLMSC